MDLHDQHAYMEKTGQWRFTPPTHVVVALAEAVKQFVEERERTLVFVLDLSVGMGLGIGAWSARQMVARAVASLSLMAIGGWVISRSSPSMRKRTR